MRGTLVALVLGYVAISAAAGAQNLLENPDFDSTPIGNGWTATGTGSVTHQLSVGQPAPCAELDAAGSESIVLSQCRPVGGGEVYDVDARTYTSFASGASTNAVRLRWYALEGCSDELDALEVLPTFYPPGEFSHRYLHHVVSPLDAQSARVELEVVANGTPTQVRFDAIYLPEPDAGALACAVLGALFVRRRRS